MANRKKSFGDKYLSIINRRRLYVPLNNYSPFIQGSEYNTAKHFKRWFNGRVRLDMLLICKKDFAQVWLPEDDFKMAAEIGLIEYFKNRKKFDARVRYIHKNIALVDKIYATNSYEKINATSWRELLALVDKIKSLIWDANAASFVSILMDKEFLIGLLKKYNVMYSEHEISRLWNNATKPYFGSFDKAQTLDLFRRASEGVTGERLFESCQYFLTDYYNAKTTAKIAEHIRRKYGKNILNVSAAKISLKYELSEIVKLRQEWRKVLSGLSSQEQRLAQYLQAIIQIRDIRKNLFAKGLTVIYRIAEKMFNEEGVNKEFIPFYTIQELLKGARYIRQASVQKDLGLRLRGFELFIPYQGKVKKQNIVIKEAKTKLDKYFRASYQTQGGRSDIRGSVAYPGKLVGRVKIILNANSRLFFKTGDILVAGMTRPEYLPFMKKAAAVITDEGGITCHAAIVSREMKKPCIIGTKIATKVLKDGDIVEVDAEKGIIKIFK